MCLLIVAPPGTDIVKDYLENGFHINDDGAGYAFSDHENGVVRIRKGVQTDFDKFWAKISEERRKFQESTFMIHFRMATTGKVDRSNCHPFRVNKALAMAHNGIIGIKNSNLPKASDTFIFNEGVAKGLPEEFYRNQSLMLMMEMAIGNSKVAFINSNGEHFIANEGMGQWDSGIWYSNSNYKSTYWKNKTVTTVYTSRGTTTHHCGGDGGEYDRYPYTGGVPANTGHNFSGALSKPNEKAVETGKKDDDAARVNGVHQEYSNCLVCRGRLITIREKNFRVCISCEMLFSNNSDGTLKVEHLNERQKKAISEAIGTEKDGVVVMCYYCHVPLQTDTEIAEEVCAECTRICIEGMEDAVDLDPSRFSTNGNGDLAEQEDEEGSGNLDSLFSDT